MINMNKIYKFYTNFDENFCLFSQCNCFFIYEIKKTDYGNIIINKIFNVLCIEQYIIVITCKNT